MKKFQTKKPNIHRMIAADLAQRLSSGEFPVGKPLPSYRWLAQSYGVGVQTIRSAFKILVASGDVLTRPRRVSQAALSAPLASIMANSLALVLPSEFSLDAKFRLEMLRGLTRALKGTGWTLIVLQHSTRWRKEFPAGLAHLPLSGVVLVGPFKPFMLQQYEKMTVPVVLMDQPVEKLKFHSVSMDNHNASKDAVMRLIAYGHQRIAFIRKINFSIQNIDPDSKEREAGFLAACEEARLQKENFKIYTSTSHDWRSVAKKIVRVRPRFTAVVCDDYGTELIAGIQKDGVRVPRDLSLAMFHAKGQAEHFSGPQLNFELLGRTAGELLFRRPKVPEHVRIPAKWNEGSTIAAPH